MSNNILTLTLQIASVALELANKEVYLVELGSPNGCLERAKASLVQAKVALENYSDHQIRFGLVSDWHQQQDYAEYQRWSERTVERLAKAYQP